MAEEQEMPDTYGNGLIGRIDDLEAELQRTMLDAAAHMGRRDAEIEALIAAGNKLAGFAGHTDDCREVLAAWGEVELCTCGYTEAWKAWAVARRPMEDE